MKSLQDMLQEREGVAERVRQREEWERVGGRERDRNDLKLLIERTKQRQVEKKKKAQMSIV